jgi:hypothetical protein
MLLLLLYSKFLKSSGLNIVVAVVVFLSSLITVCYILGSIFIVVVW